MHTKESVFLFSFINFFISLAQVAHGQYTMADTAMASKIVEESRQLYIKQQYAASIEKGKQAIVIFDALGIDNTQTARKAHSFTGLSCLYLNMNTEALANLQKALEIQKKVTPPDYVLMAVTYEHLGFYYNYTMQGGRAAELFQIAIDILEKNVPPSDPYYQSRIDVLYNNISDSYNKMGLTQKAIEASLKSIDLQTALNKPRFQSYSIVGDLLTRLGDTDKAIIYYHKSIEDGMNTVGRTEVMGSIYIKLGSKYSEMGNYRQANYYLSRGLQLRQERLGKTSPKLINDYLDVGIAQLRFGDAETALEYYQTALSIIHSTSPLNHNNLSKALRNLGGLYIHLEKHEIARQYLHQSIEQSLLAFGKNNQQEWLADMTLTYSFLKTNQVDSALVYCQKATDLITLHLPGNKNQEFQTLSLTSSCVNVQKDYQKRLNLGHHLMEFVRTYLPNNTREIARLNFHIGAALYKLDSLEEALPYFETASKQLGFNGKNINSITDLQLLGFIYKAWGHVFLMRYIRTRDLAHVALAREKYAVFDQAIQYDRNQNLNTYQNWDMEEVLDGYGYLIGMEYQLDTLRVRTEAFSYAEKTKALRLYDQIQQSNALKFAGIPDSLLDQENQLRGAISFYDKRRHELEETNMPPTDSALTSIASQLLALRQQHQTLQKTFETDYPNYYQLKYDFHLEDIASVQRDLLYPDMALVEYFLADSNIFIFTIGKAHYSHKRVAIDFPLETWVQQLRTGMTAFHTDPNMALKYDSLSALYTSAAANLYDKLVAPVADELPAKVIFIPDGILGYIPFEALLAERPANPSRWSQHHYLINDHSVSYCYSATMLREMMYRKHHIPPTVNFIGFAPAYTGDTTLLANAFKSIDDMRKALVPLPSSGEEVFRIAKLMKGKSLVGQDATKKNFSDQAGKARVVHLAAHGQANDRSGDYCFLVFAEQADSAENEILYARDIYNLQLNADLVTLSACETGIGELQEGEGIISLARAFAYAGAKSIVTSLWSVSDAKTKDLMLDFYRNLRKGDLKDDALRQAKLDFLKRNKGQAAHPFYWAGFVGIGSMAPLR